MLISQTVSTLATPSMREAMLFGGAREEWERLFDQAATVRQDEAVLRTLENEARREEHRRHAERKGLWCMPAPAAARVGRPHVFRATFFANAGAGTQDVWIDSSYYAVDGVSGKVQSFVDYIDSAHLLTQATSARQIAVPTADATMAGALTGTFLPAGPTYYVSTRAPGLWKFCHDANDMELLHGHVAGSAAVNSSLVGTFNTANTQIGLHSSYIPGGSGGFGITVANGSGVFSRQITTGAIGLAAGAAGYFYFRKSVANLNPDLQALLKSAALGSGDLASPSSADPSATLHLGVHTGLGLAADYRFRFLYILHRVMNTAERTVHHQYIQKDTGMTP